MKIVTLSIMALYYTFIVSAQTHYYTETKTFEEDGYTYQCDVKYGFVTLYNKENKLTYEKNIDRSTGGVYYPKNNSQRCLEEETWSKPKCYSIVNQAFSSKEKARVEGKEFIITLCINPKNGEVLEVYFNFLGLTSVPYTTIPLSVYRKIEVGLKKDLRFIPAEYSKNLNYILLCWSQDPNETIKNTLDEPLKPIGPIKGEDGFDDKLRPDENPLY